MKLKEIISVPGMPGLFKIIGNNKNGVIVESLSDSKRTMINASQRIMTLSEISVYTTDGEISLREVFKKVREKDGGKLSVDPKGDPKKLGEYFKAVLPDFDQERVYSSDIRKMLTWYDILKDKIDFDKEEEKDDDGTPIPSQSEHDKPINKVHEAHGPKTEHAKTSTARTRKKV